MVEKLSCIFLFDSQCCPKHVRIPRENNPAGRVTFYSWSCHVHFLNDCALAEDHTFMLDTNRDSPVDGVFLSCRDVYRSEISSRSPAEEISTSRFYQLEASHAC